MIIPLVPLYVDDLDGRSGGQNLKENIKEESQTLDITVICQVGGETWLLTPLSRVLQVCW